MYVRTYISLSSSTILAPKGQRLKRTLESKLELPYSSGHHFFWQLVSCSRLGCCHCSIFVVVVVFFLAAFVARLELESPRPNSKLTRVRNSAQNEREIIRKVCGCLVCGVWGGV